MRIFDGFAIRGFLAQDVEGVLACLKAAFAPYRDRYTPEAFADTILDSKKIWERVDEMFLFVAIEWPPRGNLERVIGTISVFDAGAKLPDEEDRPAGYDAKTFEGHLRGMAVLPEFQGKPVADALLMRAEQALHNNGCKRVTLDTTEPLQRAIRFYERHGYRPSGQVRDFFGMKLIEYEKQIDS